ncbi:hypothetical protein AVEN_160651-1 [Araneus ventricosus]|uniref:Uncharacterized protein n=1 Tax=Araneus ventricosus TaxID=182803 RepID=A0A4Y2Q411_ARAVE|nr:hypothetical protein AVEN_160651-1 [Araneus ventricosus]
MMQHAAGTILDGSSAESGFEHGALWLRGRYLTTRPPRPTINSFEIIALCKRAFLPSFIQRCRNGLQASVCSTFFVVHCTSELENRRPLTLS